MFNASPIIFRRLLGNEEYNTYPNERRIQRWALATFYFSLYGLEWTTKDGWLDSNTLGDECSWHGITCEENTGVVKRIDLSENYVQGDVPHEVALLYGLGESVCAAIVLAIIEVFVSKCSSLFTLNKTKSTWDSQRTLYAASHHLCSTCQI